MKFKEGDVVIVTNGDKYFYTKTGSEGIVEICGNERVSISFYKLTGPLIQPLQQSISISVEKDSIEKHIICDSPLWKALE